MLTKRSWLAFTLLLASPAFASAQLRFSQPSIDMGEQLGGPVYQHRFEFVNESQLPVDVTDFRLGCGCVQPVLAKRIYQAGEKGTLLMNVRTLGQPDGARTWRTHIQYRSGDKMLETELLISAKIRNEVTIEPSIIAMTVDTTLRQEVTIKDSRAKPMKVTAVRASSPAIKVITQDLNGGGTKVILEVSGSELTAARQEEILNIYTDDPNYRQLQVPITLVKAHRVEVSATPERVEFTGAGSQLVRLRATGEQAVRIAKAEATDTGIKCTWAPGPGNDATLKISVDPSRLSAPNALVRIQLSEPAGMLTIPVKLGKE